MFVDISAWDSLLYFAFFKTCISDCVILVTLLTSAVLVLLNTSLWNKALLEGLASSEPKHFCDHPKGKGGGRMVLLYISWWPLRLLHWVHLWCLAEAYGIVLHQSMLLWQHELFRPWLALLCGQAKCRQAAQRLEELPWVLWLCS